MRSVSGFRVAGALFFLVAAGMLAPDRGSAFSGGPPDFRTWCAQGGEPACGAAPCSNCTVSCHSTFGGPNSGTGSVTLQNLPPAYRPGAQYILAVLLEDPDNPEFVVGGFELSALERTGLCQAGALAADEADTRVDLHGPSGTQWLKHSRPQDQAGGAMWQFLWTAPDPSVGEVVFSVCANAADDNGGNRGDRIYCSEAVVPQEDAPVPEPELTVGRTAGLLALSWSGGADGFNLYRGPLALVGEIVTATAAYQQAACGVPGNEAEDPGAALGSGESFFYLVVPQTAGREQTYGCTDLDGDGLCSLERLKAAAACP